MTAADRSADLQAQVKDAVARSSCLAIYGGNSRTSWLGPIQGERLSTAEHRGVVNYAPTELVITARSGTTLAELDAVLKENGQMLAFEPGLFGPHSTIGGAIACNQSGPRRPFAGAARDFVLGSRILNGKGELLRFGGEVMKNVAGYDVSRGLAGSYGTLGVILELSLKVLPRPTFQLTLAREQSDREAIDHMNRWSAEPYPISAAAFDGERLLLRLEGAESAVRAAQKQLGGEVLSDGAALWQSLSNQSHGFFSGQGPLWRISVPPATAPLNLPGKWLYDWGGGLRWYRGSADVDAVRNTAMNAGGHAACFRDHGNTPRFQPLNPLLLQLHRRIKRAFDPESLFNRGLLFAEL